MNVFEIRDFCFKYPSEEKYAIDNVSLDIKMGEFVVLCGASGSGKTTLLKQLKPCLAPRGDKQGKVLFFGQNTNELSDRAQAEKIGYVMQDTENQIVTDKVWHELAFGLESLGVKSDEIRRRVAEMASFFGIGDWFRKSVSELSGGQKQILNLASVMVMRPDVLILDEPSSQLDPIAAENFFAMLHKINRETGTTIILSEHRLEEVLPICSRLIVMEEGRILHDGIPKAVGKMLKESDNSMFADMPTAMRIYGEVENGSEYPLTVKEGRDWLSRYAENHTLCGTPQKEIKSSNEIAAELKEVHFRYSKELDDVIRGASLKVKKGEFLAIVGGNGSGKTTLLSLISGLNTPYYGTVKINGVPIKKVEGLYDEVLGVLPQNPQTLFVKKTVHEDLLEMSGDEKRVAAVAKLCRLTELLRKNPYDLSGGEQQRAALAKVLLKNPEILILDEPTKGMNKDFKRIMAAILQDLVKMGVTVIMVSHDIEFCAEYADRVAMFFDGEITSIGSSREFFADNSLYTTAAGRISNGIINNAIVAEDIISACGVDIVETDTESVEYGKVLKDKESKPKSQLKEYLFGKPQPIQTIGEKRKLPGRTKIAALMILLFIPLTIFFGIYYLNDRKYYFISLLVMLEAMLPFAMIYESRKPKARELTLIAAMCALGAASRVALFFVPQFKPLLTIVILSGAAFGGEAGFLVGAMSMLISNFYFGQGPHTPWQMLATGAVGYIGGVLFKKGLIRRGRLPLALYGGIATIAIFGGIVNPSYIFMSQSEITWQAIVSSWVMGFPYDVIHAVSTVIIMWVASIPVLDKLERIKQKYGIYD